MSRRGDAVDATEELVDANCCQSLVSNEVAAYDRRSAKAAEACEHGLGSPEGLGGYNGLGWSGEAPVPDKH